jgi:hypothetical protein
MHELRTEEVLTLRRTLVRMQGEERISLLQVVCGRSIRSPKALREWHDLLLFLLAHPANMDEHTLATVELERVVGLSKAMVGGNERTRYGLINSGLEGAPLQSTYTHRLTRWMLERWGAALELFSLEAPLDEFRELLRLLLSPAEWETVDQSYADVYELLNCTYGPSRALQLQRLVEALSALRCDERTREHLWSRMQVYVKAEGAVGCAMTLARAPIDAPFCLPNGLQRGADLMTAVNDPLAAPVRLPANQQRALIDTARTVLATLHRETDPVTHAGAVELFDMGRGLRIALYHLDVEHRLPFDSYVGFMAFRNGVPLAYGGAWIFPGRSKVGINVFPALRGGESAWFFTQLLRLYRQRFGVDRFEAENYQLGHNNPDGLKSGAYWFYYRLGFRPVTKALQRIAESEFKMLTSRKDHQVPLKLLKQLVEQGLELAVESNAVPVTDTAALTMAIQRYVAEQFEGDRKRAMRRTLERLARTLPLGDLVSWTVGERQALYLWAIPLGMIAELEHWSPASKQALVKLIRDKGASTETAHQKTMSKHIGLLAAWQVKAVW